MMRRKLIVAALLVFAPLVQAQAPGTVDAAIELVRKGRHAEAAAALEPLAGAGNAQAQYQLGMLHYNGKGVPENERKAVDLLNRSAQQGNVEAMYQLGNAYTFGNETARMVADADTEAASWYYKAAKLGHADAQYSLGLLFMAGKGLQKNEKEATYWMQQAAKNGHKDARSYIAGRR